MNKASEIRPGANIYLSGQDKLNQLPEYLAGFASIAVITGERSFEVFRNYYAGAFDYPVYRYDGSASEEDASRLANEIGHTQVIIGIGGGRVLDTAKMAAQELSCQLIIIPTLVSNCAPYAPVIAVYHPDHSFKKMGFLTQAAYITLVDWQFMLSTPQDYFIAGIGDTLAKWYEIEGITRKLKPENITAPVRLGIACGKEILAILLQDSQQALDDLKNQRLSPAFGRIVDTIIALSGVTGGFAAEYGRTAGAHAIHNGLSYIPATHEILHGAKVAYGILVQLAYSGDSEEIKQRLAFYKSVGLPCTLNELNIAATDKDALQKMAEFAASDKESFRMIDEGVTAQAILAAIAKVEAITA